MADDLIDLPEFDFENLEMKAWMEQEEVRQRQTLADIKRKEVISFLDRLVQNVRLAKPKNKV